MPIIQSSVNVSALLHLIRHIQLCIRACFSDGICMKAAVASIVRKECSLVCMLSNVRPSYLRHCEASKVVGSYLI